MGEIVPNSMKGSFAEVIKPISEAVVKPYMKSWAFWGNVHCEMQQVRENDKDLTGFFIDVVTGRGTYRHTFKRKTDSGGFFIWEQVKEEKLKA